MTTAAIPFSTPGPPGRIRSALLAVIMHGLLALLLVFGIHWQSQPPAVIEAELWSALPQVAAPPPPPPAPEAPATIEDEPAPPKPDIAIAEPKPKPKKKEIPKPVKIVKPVAIKPLPPKPLPVKPQLKTPPRPSQSIEALQAAAGVPSNGADRRTSAPRASEEYIARIRTKILSNLRFPLPPDMKGNPEADFMVEQLPSGEIVSVRKAKSSGLPAYDAAVERAIQASSPLPRPKEGNPEPRLDLRFHPLDKPGDP